MRRNDVVRLKDDGVFFGRIIRIIDDKALWICSGLHIHLTPLDRLEKTDYKGYLEWAAGRDDIVYF